jgi:uncharacterized protein (DUF1499 family)
MKIVWLIASLIGVLAVALLVAGRLGLLTGKAPKLGVVDGRLKPPSKTPNSVTSQANLYPDHPQNAYASIAPFSFQGDGEAAIRQLAQVMQQMPRTVIVTQNPDYLYAQCNTALLQFTDDVEFWVDTASKVIQVRSASRLGKSDLGANRKRVEAVRAAFTSLNSAAPQMLPNN